MNLYFLVEGDTEKMIYTAWLKYLVPQLTEATSLEDVITSHYYLVSLGGQSSIKRLLGQAIREANEVGRFDYFILCLDAEDMSITYRTDEIGLYLQELAQEENIQLTHGEFILIVQNRCLETWLLGNQAMYPDNPRSNELKEFLNFYHAGHADPELMGNPKAIYKHPYSRHARFHKRYFHVLLDEQGIKKAERLAEAAKPTYLSELQNRITITPTHLQTFQTFIDFCQRIT